MFGRLAMRLVMGGRLAEIIRLWRLRKTIGTQCAKLAKES